MPKESFEVIFKRLQSQMEDLVKRVEVLEKKPSKGAIRDGWSVASMAKELGKAGDQMVMDALRVAARSFSERNGLIPKVNGTQRKVEFFCNEAANHAMSKVRSFYED